jgi:hypothetical protein
MGQSGCNRGGVATSQPRTANAYSGSLKFQGFGCLGAEKLGRKARGKLQKSLDFREINTRWPCPTPECGNQSLNRTRAGR